MINELDESDKDVIKKLEDTIINLERMTQKMESVTAAIIAGCISEDPLALQRILKEQGVTNEKD